MASINNTSVDCASTAHHAHLVAMSASDSVMAGQLVIQKVLGPVEAATWDVLHEWHRRLETSLDQQSPFHHSLVLAALAGSFIGLWFIEPSVASWMPCPILSVLLAR